MKQRLVVFFLAFFLTGNLSAQHKYNKFVQDKKIQWAADFSDTFHFSNPNLSELLRTQFFDGKIKVALVEDPETMQQVRFESLPTVLQRMRPNEEIAPAVLKDSLFSPNAFNEQTKDLLEIRDIIYVEKGRLKSQVYAVSPKYIVQTSWGMILGTSNLFITAFNTKRNWSKSVQRKAIAIGGSNRRVVLNEDAGTSLKKLYNQNLLEAVWPYLDGKYFDIIRLDSMKEIQKSDVNLDMINVPVSDPNGTISSNARFVPQLTPESFYSLDIFQKWFYNKEKNILFTIIDHLILNIKSGDGNSNNQIVKPLLKIVVK